MGQESVAQKSVFSQEEVSQQIAYLAEQCHPQFVAYAKSLESSAPEDIVQATYLAILASYSSLQKPVSIQYIMSSILNRRRDESRRQKTALKHGYGLSLEALQENMPGGLEEANTALSAEEEVISKESFLIGQDRAKLLMSSLGILEKQVLIETVIKETPQPEAAQKLRRSVDVVKSTKSRALQKLRNTTS